MATQQRPEEVLRKQRLIDILVREKDSVIRSIRNLDNYFVRTTERERILSDGRLLKATADAFGLENPNAEGVPASLPDSIYKLIVEIVNLLNFRSNLVTERTVKEKCDAVNREKSSAVALAVSVAEKQVARDVARVWEDRMERENADARLKHSRDLEELAARLSDEHEKEMHVKEHEHQLELVKSACDSKLKAVAQLADNQHKAIEANSEMWKERMEEMREELLRERERAISAAVRAVEATNRSQQSLIEGRSASKRGELVINNSDEETDVDVARAAAAIGRSRLELQEQLLSPLPTPPRVAGISSQNSEDEANEGEEEPQEDNNEWQPSPIDKLLRVTASKLQLQRVLTSQYYLSSSEVVASSVVPFLATPKAKVKPDTNFGEPAVESSVVEPELKNEEVPATIPTLSGSHHQQAVQWLCATFASPEQVELLQVAIKSSSLSEAKVASERSEVEGVNKAVISVSTTATRPRQQSLGGGGGGALMKKMVKAKTMSLQLTRAARVPRGFPHPRFRSKAGRGASEKDAKVTNVVAGEPLAPTGGTGAAIVDTHARDSLDMSVDFGEGKSNNDDGSDGDRDGADDANSLVREVGDDVDIASPEVPEVVEPSDVPSSVQSAESAVVEPKQGMRQRLSTMLKNQSKRLAGVSARLHRSNSMDMAQDSAPNNTNEVEQPHTENDELKCAVDAAQEAQTTNANATSIA
jgi:hypothetical protein